MHTDSYVADGELVYDLLAEVQPTIVVQAYTELARARAEIAAVLCTGTDVLWVATRRQGLYRLEGSSVETFPLPAIAGADPRRRSRTGGSSRRTTTTRRPCCFSRRFRAR